MQCHKCPIEEECREAKSEGRLKELKGGCVLIATLEDTIEQERIAKRYRKN